MFTARVTAQLSSWVWRLLTAYGRIKYRYLLPIYRKLKLLPNDQKSRGTNVPTKTLRGAQALVRKLSNYGHSYYRDQLKAVVDLVRHSKGAVIFLPSVGWDIVNVQRPHHLAREFARQGYVSIFDTTNQYDDVNGLKQIEPNLFLSRVDTSMLSEIPDPILWAFTYNYDRSASFNAGTRTVYDWIDDLEVFPYDPGFLRENHERALREATVVTCVARRLLEQAAEIRPDALYLPNGVECERFRDSSLIDDDRHITRLKREGKPVAGYYGAMAEWFDYELIDAVAARRPDWNFLLIGPVYDLSMRERGRAILRHENVRWIGHRRYEDIPRYLNCFDIAMIPFVINNITLATSPLKLYEYFAGGKPVVTSRMPECEAFKEVITAGNEEEFSNALDAALRLGADQCFVNRLRQISTANSWTARVCSVVELLNGDGAPQPVVIDTPYAHRLP